MARGDSGFDGHYATESTPCPLDRFARIFLAIPTQTTMMPKPKSFSLLIPTYRERGLKSVVTEDLSPEFVSMVDELSRTR